MLAGTSAQSFEVTILLDQLVITTFIAVLSFASYIIGFRQHRFGPMGLSHSRGSLILVPTLGLSAAVLQKVSDVNDAEGRLREIQKQVELWTKRNEAHEDLSKLAEGDRGRP